MIKTKARYRGFKRGRQKKGLWDGKLCQNESYSNIWISYMRKAGEEPKLEIQREMERNEKKNKMERAETMTHTRAESCA